MRESASLINSFLVLTMHTSHTVNRGFQISVATNLSKYPPRNCALFVHILTELVMRPHGLLVLILFVVYFYSNGNPLPTNETQFSSFSSYIMPFFICWIDYSKTDVSAYFFVVRQSILGGWAMSFIDLSWLFRKSLIELISVIASSLFYLQIKVSELKL